MSINKTRFFLEKNKVFFETAAAVALSVMSILVSYFQYQSSQKQNDLSERMLNISLKQIQPSINVSATYLDNDGDQKYDEERLIVTNEGNPIYSPNIETIVLVEALVHGTQNGNETLWKDVFFTRDFYSGIINMQNINSKIFSSMSYGNNDRLYTLMNEFSEEAKKASMFGDLSLKRYVMIRYQDLADKFH